MNKIHSAQLILLNIGHAIHYADWNFYECDSYFSLYYIHIYDNQKSSYFVLEDLMYPVEINSKPIDKLLVERLFAINPNCALDNYDPTKYDNTSYLINTINQQINKQTHELLETRGIIYQLLSRFMAYSTDKYDIVDNRIFQVVKYIRKNINQDISIADLLDICCLSKDHFIRLFKKDMNATPTQYINEKKMERAQLMLLTSNKSIKDIAYELSFVNVYYFNRLFKKTTGLTPSEYRLNPD